MFRRALIFAMLVLYSTPCAPSVADVIPADSMAPLYATELGNLYRPADLERIYQAHLLMEQYFTAPTQVVRRSIESQLEQTNLDPNLLGRIARLRLSWLNLSPGVYYINQRSGPHDLKYFLGIPKGYRRDVSWPLVVRLPTANAFMTDPPPDGDEVARIYSAWITQELSAHPDALVLMPLLNLTELYGPSYVGMDSVIGPILDAAGRANVDPERVYLLGHSMAAHAVWNIALHYPTYFAAICPLAGAADADWQRLRLVNLRNVLPVVWADSDDRIVPSEESGDLVSALRKLKIDVDFTLTHGVGHAPPPNLVASRYQKMRARSRLLYPRHVSLQSNRAEPIFNRVDWVQVYQELDPGPDHEIRLARGTGPIRVSENAFSLDAVINQNKVEVATQNVEDMRLYFNDQMVDLNKPVVVIVNGKERFNALLHPSLDEMLKDQVFLGRGWRYYTAVVDLDLSATPEPPPLIPQPAATAAPTSRPHGRIVIYNDDGSIQRIIETP